MEPATLIRSTRARLRSDSAREVLAEIIRPRTVRTNEPRTVTKDAATVEWETFVVSELGAFLKLTTGDESNPIARIGQASSKQQIELGRAVKGGRPDKAAEVNDRALALLILQSDAARRGYTWPLPAHFGQASYSETVEVDAPAPSLWAETFPGSDPPDLATVANLME